MAFNKAKALQEAEKSVSQGKVPQAIKLYEKILEKDPGDLILLNTIGDLYLREKKFSEALEQFSKLAEAFVREGFTVKAIAIYRKISKVDPKNPDAMLKMAELYQTQGLGREAREQYLQAHEFFRKEGKTAQALEAIRKVVALDPNAEGARERLAVFAEKAGEKKDAADAYLGLAELALGRGDDSSAASALKKAGELGSSAPKLYLLQAHLALRRKSPEQVEKILAFAPELNDNPVAKRLRLQAHLAVGETDGLEPLVLGIFQANSTDYSPVNAFVNACLRKNAFDAALHCLQALAPELMEAKREVWLIESLRQIWSAAPHHIPALELLQEVVQKAGEETSLPEIQESLGHAYAEASDFEKAEACFRSLITRDPENTVYTDLLKQVLQKQGKEYVAPNPEDLAGQELAPEAEASVAEEPAPATDEKQAAMVKEALDNSDLFTRYNLTEKAVEELEKVLAVYPDQEEIHHRIFEICQKNMAERAQQASEALARIRAQHRSAAKAAPAPQAVAEEPASSESAPAAPIPPVATPASPLAPVANAPVEIDLSQEFAFSTPTAPPVAPAGLPMDGSAPVEAPVPPVTDTPAEVAAVHETGAHPTPPNLEEASQEVDFYLQNGFRDEALRVVRGLKAAYPNDQAVAQLVERIESSAPSPTPAAETPEVSTPTAEPQSQSVPDAATLAQTAATEPKSEIPAELEVAPASPAQEPATSPNADLIGSLASDLAESMGDLEATPMDVVKGRVEAASSVTAPPVATSSSAPVADSGAAEGIAGLDGLLDELGKDDGSQGEAQDPETHYNLGVAFREMSLLDEAIGEFQKVVRGASNGHYPPHFLQACTLLAAAFSEKGMPTIAAKWLARALESPGLDAEGALALLYDMGAAYEQAGDARQALEKFTEVYSQNIDYRDVAEKIRALNQKAL